MFDKLGQKYRDRVITDTQRPQDMMTDILDFAKEIMREDPELYKILRKYDREDIEWGNVEEEELNRHFDEFKRAMMAVAPEGTMFKATEDGAWGFIPFDNALDSSGTSPEVDDFENDMRDNYMFEEKHAEYIMKEAAKRIISKVQQ